MHHREQAVACRIVTVSDTRTPETDTSGGLIRDLLVAAGHRVRDHRIIRDDTAEIREAVLAACDDSACRAVLVTGGTGIAPRDRTPEAVASILDKRLDGFGELFRMLSFERIGPVAMLSRAVAGVCHGTAVFVMPGSRGAVRLAMERLILPTLGHVSALVGDGA